MIKFRCPACQKKIGVPDSYAGKHVKCPQCGKSAEVPGSVERMSPAAGAEPSLLNELADLEAQAPELAQPAGELPSLEPLPAQHFGGGLGRQQIGVLVGGGAVAVIVIVVGMWWLTRTEPPSPAPPPRPAAEVAEVTPPAVAPDPQGPAQADPTTTPDPRPPSPDATTPTPSPSPDEPDGPPEAPPDVADAPGPEVDPQAPPTPDDPVPDEPALVMVDPEQPYRQAEQWFDEMFGQAVATALATDDLDDNTAVIERLQKQLQAGSISVARAAVLQEHIFELASVDPSGYATAAAAATQLAELRPTESARTLGRHVELAASLLQANQPPAGLDHMALFGLYLKWGDALLTDLRPAEAIEAYDAAYETGRKFHGAPFGEIVARRERTREAVQRKQQIEDLVAQLKQTPDDPQVARALAEAHLFEFDRPGKAAPFVEKLDDPALWRRLVLLHTPFDELTIEQLLDLATWYEAQARKQDAANPIAMFIRAKTYYEQYLALHREQDAQRLEVIQTKKRIDRQLTRLGVGMKKARRLVRAVRGAAGAMTDPRIDRAVARGVKWLYDHCDPDAYWEGDTKPNDRDYGGRTALACYALTMAGESAKISPPLRRAVGWVFGRQMIGTYSVCFRAHLWETLPSDRQLDMIVGRDCRRLRYAQYRNGTHGYEVTRQRHGGDLSTTLAAYLTFWLGETSGIPTVTDTHWARMAYVLIQRQSEEGGWGYRKDREDSLAMTAAAITILLMAVDQNHLKGEFQEIRADALDAIERGCQWLAKHFQPAPGGKWPCYTLAAIQHVGLLAERQHLGNHDWYADAADCLVDSQAADGSWANGNVIRTAFAVVFLARGGMQYDAYLPPPSVADTPRERRTMDVQDDDVDIGPGEDAGD